MAMEEITLEDAVRKNATNMNKIYKELDHRISLLKLEIKQLKGEDK